MFTVSELIQKISDYYSVGNPPGAVVREGTTTKIPVYGAEVGKVPDNKRHSCAIGCLLSLEQAVGLQAVAALNGSYTITSLYCALTEKGDKYREYIEAIEQLFPSDILNQESMRSEEEKKHTAICFLADIQNAHDKALSSTDFLSTFLPDLEKLKQRYSKPEQATSV